MSDRKKKRCWDCGRVFADGFALRKHGCKSNRRFREVDYVPQTAR